MSLCIALQTADVIMLSGDSRLSVNINGEHFALKKEIPKIRQIGNKVIFSGGSAEVATRILDDFSRSGDQSIEYLQHLTIEHKNAHIQKHGPDYLGKTAHAMFLVGYFDNGRSVLCGINSNDDCKIKMNYGTNQLTTAIVGPGAYTTKAHEIKQEFQRNGYGVEDMYRAVYDNLANEEIGGGLTMYTIRSTTISRKVFPIMDNRPIKTVDIAPHFNADEMFWEVAGEKVFWIDIPNMKLKFGGTLEAATGTFTGDLSAAGGTFTGTLVGVDGDFSGTISAATINGGSINGSTITGGSITGTSIQTAASGSYVRMQAGFANLAIFSDDANVFQINGSGANSLIWNPSAGGIETNSSDTWWFYSNNYFEGYTRFDAGVYFSPSAVVSGLSISSVSGLQSSLDSKGVNLAYDSATKNLKLFSATGATLATVNLS
ncbi:hypothetical protein [Cohnella sp. AR92]|uniref:hypothetical protein n=1 Tax=Cohnella sp. AR92 TaxID=648716 RepID=UPI001864B0FE|nr:hypothetical protein [Cohnella sp. AR92]